MRSEQKHLADAIWTSGECGIDALPVDTKYVLDGGSLLQKLPWTSKLTLGDISKMYSRYVASKFSNCVVVFDGYSNGPTTKDVAHIRRSKGLTRRDVFFNENHHFVKNKNCFCLIHQTNRNLSSSYRMTYKSQDVAQ